MRQLACEFLYLYASIAVVLHLYVDYIAQINTIF